MGELFTTMNQEIGVPLEGLGVDQKQKLITQEWVRRSIIPKLIARRLPAERSLLDLHYASTWGLPEKKTLSSEQQIQEILEQVRILSEKSSNVRVSMSPRKNRGQYRLLGDVILQGENQERVSTKQQHVWRFRAVKFDTGEGLATYIAPQQEIDSLMHDLCQTYDNLETKSGKPVDVALRLAFFYGIGNKLIHPFIDGNHRAFDRFLEYGFLKAGITFKAPQDSTGNIPKEEKFRVWTANLMTNFLRLEGLPLFIRAMPTSYIVHEYQPRLVKGIQELIKKQLTDPLYLWVYAKIAEELLKWTPDTYTKDILQIQEKAQRDGGFAVLHTR